jgi:hypothetical protein
MSFDIITLIFSLAYILKDNIITIHEDILNEYVDNSNNNFKTLLI